jgi:hypothetical protein
MDDLDEETPVQSALLCIFVLRKRGRTIVNQGENVMKKVFGAIAIMALLCFRAHGATLITTITIKGTGASAAGSVTASGTVGFVGDLAGSGAFSSSFTLLDPNTLSGKIPVNLTVTTGNITGTLSGIFHRQRPRQHRDYQRHRWFCRCDRFVHRERCR